MAIYKQVFRTAGTNAAAITLGSDFPGRFRLRMTEAEECRYGPYNVLRVVNKSTKKARIHFTWGVTAERYEDIEANSIRNITIDDGYSFYGFDIENLDAAADIAIGEINYLAARVEQISEGGQ